MPPESCRVVAEFSFIEPSCQKSFIEFFFYWRFGYGVMFDKDFLLWEFIAKPMTGILACPWSLNVESVKFF